MRRWPELQRRYRFNFWGILTPVVMGYGVIGSPADSGSVSLGSSPGTPAQYPAIQAINVLKMY